MKRTIVAIGTVLVLAVPASSGAANPDARWLTYPTCSATATTLTCTGRAVVANPRAVYGLGELQAAIIGSLRFTCPDPVFDLFWPIVGDLRYQWAASTTFHNGQTFTMSVARSQLYPPRSRRRRLASTVTPRWIPLGTTSASLSDGALAAPHRSPHWKPRSARSHLQADDRITSLIGGGAAGNLP